MELFEQLCGLLVAANSDYSVLAYSQFHETNLAFALTHRRRIGLIITVFVVYVNTHFTLAAAFAVRNANDKL